MHSTNQRLEARISQYRVSQVRRDKYTGRDNIRAHYHTGPGQFPQRDVLVRGNASSAYCRHTSVKCPPRLCQADNVRVHINQSRHQVVLFAVNDLVPDRNYCITNGHSLYFSATHKNDPVLVDAILFAIEDVHVCQRIGIDLRLYWRRHMKHNQQANGSDQIAHL